MRNIRLGFNIYQTKIIGKQDHYVVQSDLDIGYGKQSCIPLINRIKARIIRRIERKMLCAEQQQILKYANKMPQDKVITAKDYSWSWVLQTTIEVIEVIVAKMGDRK